MHYASSHYHIRIRISSTLTQLTKLNLPNSTYQTQLTTLNLPNSTYHTQLTKLNLPKLSTSPPVAAHEEETITMCQKTVVTFKCGHKKASYDRRGCTLFPKMKAMSQDEELECILPNIKPEKANRLCFDCAYVEHIVCQPHGWICCGHGSRCGKRVGQGRRECSCEHRACPSCIECRRGGNGTAPGS